MKPEDVKTWNRLLSMDSPAEDILEALLGVKIVYMKTISRFAVYYNGDLIRYVTFSAQLSYVLGFDEATKIRHKAYAKYMPDMEGGVSNLCIYSNITENMIVGDRMASLLSVVAVTGKPNRTVEVVYDTPIFNKILSKQMNRIDIEIRTLDNRLVPFDYGVVVMTLMFKKLLF